MSKEQTPIEELVIKLADLYTDLGNAKRPDQGMKLVSTITKEIEQFTQYREKKAVLEVLSDVRSVGENSERLLDKIDELISEL